MARFIAHRPMLAASKAGWKRTSLPKYKPNTSKATVPLIAGSHMADKGMTVIKRYTTATSEIKIKYGTNIPESNSNNQNWVAKIQ